LKLDQAKRLKELEKENAKLKRVVAELSLEKQVLKDPVPLKIRTGYFGTLSGKTSRCFFELPTLSLEIG
jgi:hypothetical protein